MPNATDKPTTEAGRRLRNALLGLAVENGSALGDILAIEAEAAAAERAAIRAALVRATKGAADAPFFLGILDAREPAP